MVKENLAVEVTLSWEGNPLATTLVREGSLVVGPNLGAWVLLPLAENHSLLAQDADGAWRLKVPSGASVLATRNGAAIPVDGELAMSSGTIAELKIDSFSFFMRATQVELAPVRKSNIDWKALRYVGAALALHGAMLAVFAMMPPNASALNLDPNAQEQRYVQVSLLGQETPPPPPSHGTSGSQNTDPSDAPQPGSRGGDHGDVSSIPRGGHENQPRGARPRPTFIVPHASEAGILQVLENGTALTWGDDDSSPYNAQTAEDGPGGPGTQLALLLPGGPGWSYGPDMVNPGHGTCDPTRQQCGAGTIEVGHLDTHHDPGPEVVLHQHVDRAPSIPTPVVATTGALSADDVRLTIRRHINEVRFCYEQELQSQPQLEGRVAVTFIIAPSGAVSSAGIAQNTVDERVGSCVTQAVHRWQFPQAQMSTGVTYPFVMQSGD